MCTQFLSLQPQLFSVYSFFVLHSPHSNSSNLHSMEWFARVDVLWHYPFYQERLTLHKIWIHFKDAPSSLLCKSGSLVISISPCHNTIPIISLIPHSHSIFFCILQYALPDVTLVSRLSSHSIALIFLEVLGSII